MWGRKRAVLSRCFMEGFFMVYDRRPDDMVRITTPELAAAFIEEQVEALRAQVG